MTKREEIINSLNACMDVHQSGLWSSGCMLCAYEKQSNPKCFMDLTKDVIELLKEQPVKDTNVPSKWISVEDRLPETRHAVLVYTPHHKNIWAASMHEDGNWYIWSPGGKVLLDTDWHGPITHWMPLPEPPKEVKQDD